MKFLILLFVIYAVVADQDNDKWSEFKNKYDKHYTNVVEETLRFNVFKDNLRKIDEHNKKFEAGLSTFKMKVTQFTDLTAGEFQDRLKLSVEPESKYPRNIQDIKVDGDLPSEVDWRAKGAVTEVKNQGGCGSCWTFSTTGTVEGANFLKTGNLVSLSEQNLVDCAHDNCFGCGGGWMDKALEYIKDNGIMTELDYPYEAKDDTCKFDSTKSVLTITNFTFVKEGNEDDLQTAVAKIGPTSVAIQASFLFQFYGGGILDDSSCGNTIQDMNHGVLVVGYGTEDTNDYWIVKNSWGGTWGEDGYIRMSRNKGNQCGIATYATYPIL
ncbi:procathepsin L-like [Diorhabda carinulata]|uniref:procathepsin L-like n=1 Tax=Diorhabda carinulata TaxID=1163345 RepID=UPI0025A27100|nr:procathepsin L-like [Diorhabda carinulata]